MSPISIEFPADWPHVTIYPVYDVHVGTPEFDYKAFAAYLERIGQDPYGLVVLGGDLIDNATKSSIGSIYNAVDPPMAQKKRIVELLTPIKDKIIAVVTGNHERRTYREVGQDITYDICSKLDIESKYRENMAFIKIKVGKNATHSGNGGKIVYTVLATHGAGGGMYIGSSMNKTENYLMAVDGVDIMITGHVHKSGVSKPSKIVFDSNHNRVSIKESLNVICGSWMEYGGYAMQKLLRPGAMGCAKIVLSGSRKDFEAII